MNAHKITERCSEFRPVFPVITKVIIESGETQRIKYRGA